MINYNKAPAQLREQLTRYVEERIEPGSFLTAVLSNDLIRAVGHADEENMLTLKATVSFVYNELPGVCWGSSARVNNWLNQAEADPAAL